ncbi:hypothetical protein [Streptomyces sp. NPDC127084]|uniref:hypothetical protein n=1 Tax=Streptomyces sp. NPDC127084 TaxID=3347133 RepID=UPI00365893C7
MVLPVTQYHHRPDRAPSRRRRIGVGRRIEETAEAMDASPAAVRTRSTRALTKLRSLLGSSLSEFVSL